MITIDIEMPEKCGLCPCFHSEYPIYCQAIKVDRNNKKIIAPYGAPRPEWCPLKEQEAVKPVRDKVVGRIWLCENCGVLITELMNYCYKCGKRIEWEGR